MVISLNDEELEEKQQQESDVEFEDLVLEERAEDSVSEEEESGSLYSSPYDDEPVPSK